MDKKQTDKTNVDKKNRQNNMDMEIEVYGKGEKQINAPVVCNQHTTLIHCYKLQSVNVVLLHASHTFISYIPLKLRS